MHRDAERWRGQSSPCLSLFLVLWLLAYQDVRCKWGTCCLWLFGRRGALFGLQEKRMGASSMWMDDQVPCWEYWTWHLTLSTEAALIAAQLIPKERNEAVSPASLWHPCLLSGSAGERAAR